MNGYPLFVGFSSISDMGYTPPQTYCSLMVAHFRVHGTNQLFLAYSSGYDFGGHRLPSGRLWLTFEDSPALSSGLIDLVDTLERGGHCVCFDSVTAFNLS